MMFLNHLCIAINANMKQSVLLIPSHQVLLIKFNHVPYACYNSTWHVLQATENFIRVLATRYLWQSAKPLFLVGANLQK